MKKVLLVVSSFLIVGAIYMGAKELYIKKLQESNDGLAANILIPDGAIQQGSTEPKVEIVEFMDPQCESCRDFSVVVKQALKRYSDQARLTIRYIPFHEHSRFAIKILEASRRQNKYWEALDIIFRYQDYWGAHHGAKPELLWRFLPEAGINIEQIKADIAKYDADYNQIIERDFSDAKKLEIRATPAFYINGERLQQFGAGAFFELIEKQLNAK